MRCRTASHLCGVTWRAPATRRIAARITNFDDDTAPRIGHNGMAVRIGDGEASPAVCQKKQGKQNGLRPHLAHRAGTWRRDGTMSARGVDGAPGGTAVPPGKAAQRRHVPRAPAPCGTINGRALSCFARTFQAADWLSSRPAARSREIRSFCAQPHAPRSGAGLCSVAEAPSSGAHRRGVWHESNHQ